VCNARQRGAEASRGEIIVSSDADTIYPPGWLSTIDAAFRADQRVIAVAGPCRYTAGPVWGRIYGRLLFGTVDVLYRLTGRVVRDCHQSRIPPGRLGGLRHSAHPGWGRARYPCVSCAAAVSCGTSTPTRYGPPRAV
jgi:hypothetical protein